MKSFCKVGDSIYICIKCYLLPLLHQKHLVYFIWLHWNCPYLITKELYTVQNKSCSQSSTNIIIIKLQIIQVYVHILAKHYSSYSLILLPQKMVNLEKIEIHTALLPAVQRWIEGSKRQHFLHKWYLNKLDFTSEEILFMIWISFIINFHSALHSETNLTLMSWEDLSYTAQHFENQYYCVLHLWGAYFLFSTDLHKSCQI